MPIAPHMLAAFAGKKKPNNQIEDDEDEIDELDTAAEGEDEADEEAAEADEEEAEGEDEEEGDEEEEEGDLDLDALIDTVESGDGDPALMSLAQGVSDENNPPAWVVDEDIWEEAKDAVEDHWDEMSEPYAVVAHVYKAMGGEISEAGE